MGIYELSRDYARAWKLIQCGDHLACEYDRPNHRDVGRVEKSETNNSVVINGWCHYMPSGFRDFAKRCTELNIEFYLPLPSDTLVISPEDFVKVATDTVNEAMQPIEDLIQSMNQSYGR